MLRILLAIFLLISPAYGQQMLGGNTGTSPPANSTGKEGDYFFNTNNGSVYGPKSTGAWPSVAATPAYPYSGGTITSPVVISADAAASTPPLSMTGAWFTGGSGTTTKPAFLIEPTGTPSTTWVTAGTGLGVNAPATFSASGKLADFRINGLSVFSVSGGGIGVFNSNVTAGSFVGSAATSYLNLVDTYLTRHAAAVWQLGQADAAAPVAQSIGVQNVVAGTADTAGATFKINGSAGTGTGAGGSILFQVAPAGLTGTAQNALATALTLDANKAATFAGPHIAAGTAPTAAGGGGTCATGAIAGGTSAGTITLTGVCAATNTITLTFPSPAPAGYNCTISNRNVPANLIYETSVTSTTVSVFTASGTSSGATNVLQYMCMGY